MKVALYSPYLDTFGGGERYMLTIAEMLSKKANVDLLFDNHLYSMGADNLLKDLAKRFDLDLSNINIIKAPIGEGSNFIERYFFLKSYDTLFYLTDGSIFYPSAKRNILHIQSPIIGQPAKTKWGKLKLQGWNLIIYNSKFTKDSSQNYWPLKSEVIYPPVDIKKIKSLEKKKYILSVGRFFGYLKDKKHEILIKTFKEISKNEIIKDWSLHLVGSAGEGDKIYLKNLKSLTKGFKINFYPNLNFDKLIRLYGESSIYWHAAGFKENESEKMEHFGISTVEAMAGGCIPIVIKKGGQVEIVEEGKSGFLWETTDELKRITIELISNNTKMRDVAKDAIKRSLNFSKEEFEKKILNILGVD